MEVIIKKLEKIESNISKLEQKIDNVASQAATTAEVSVQNSQKIARLESRSEPNNPVVIFIFQLKP